MIVLVKSDDKRLFGLMERFALESNMEYEQMRKGMKLRVLGLTGRIPEALGCMAYEVEGGVALDIPFSVPEIEYIQAVVSRYFKVQLKEKWKDKIASHLRSYLDSEGVSYSFVGVVGESEIKRKNGGIG